MSLFHFILAVVVGKGAECDVNHRERKESESSNHSNPEETSSDQKIISQEKEDFKVKVNVATDLKELRKRVEGLQHIKRIKELKAKNQLEKKTKKSVKSLDESENSLPRVEQTSVIKTKLTKTKSLPVQDSKDSHNKHQPPPPQRKSSKKKLSKKLTRQTSDNNMALKIENKSRRKTSILDHNNVLLKNSCNKNVI